MKYQTNKKLFTSLAVVLSLAVTAVAQNNERRQQNNDRRQNNERRESNSDGKQQQRQANLQLEPRGWISVAADYDNDGTYDAVETIYYYDLERARERSKQRSEKERQARRSRDRSSNQDSSTRSVNRNADSKRQRRFARKTSVEGEIVELQRARSNRSNSSNASNVMAKVRASNGKIANVCLGPQKGIQKLELRKGDRVSAEGVLARMNNKPVLLAARVKANGETVTHKLTRRRGINRHDGEIVDLRTVNSRRGDGQFAVAQIETEQGTKTVHLGPKRQLSKLDLSEGDRISVLTRSGRVNGKSALIALQIRANDETVKVVREARRSTNRNRR